MSMKRNSRSTLWRNICDKCVKVELILAISFIAVIVLGTVISENFLDVKYLLKSTTMYVELGMIALPFTLLMISGEIDLSVAANLTLSAGVATMLFTAGMPMWMTIPVSMLCGTLLGLINGALVVGTGLSSLIVTIGTMSLYRGLANVIVGDGSVGGFPDWFNGIDDKLLFDFLPVTTLMFALLAVAFSFLLTRTYYGRTIFGIGSNQNAAFYSAVPVAKTKLSLFALTGAVCGLAGILSMSRLEMARYNIHSDGQMDIVVMVLMGGTAFTGGHGSIWGTAIAFLVVVMFRVAMMLANLNNYYQMMCIGFTMIVVMVFTNIIENYRKRNRLS